MPSPFHRSVSALLVVFGLAFPSLAQTPPLVLPDNMTLLHCQPPDATIRFVESNEPGQIFYADEAVTLTLAFAKGTHQGEADFQLEIQPIGTRSPGRVTQGMEGFTDTAGHAPLLDLLDKPTLYPFKVPFGEGKETTVTLNNVPIPKPYGTYALIVVEGTKRQFVGTVARVLRPKAGGNLENTPLLGEGTLSDRKHYDDGAAKYERFGVHGIRAEIGWNENADGTTNFTDLDNLFGALARHHIQTLVTLSGAPEWALPFGVPTPAARWTPKTRGYGGTGDWLMEPKHYSRYARWITTFTERYSTGEMGSLWGIDLFNEPWEGGSISGWARDLGEYRTLTKTIAQAVRSVAPQVKICAASSIMNTEDKLYSDGTKTFDSFIDVFTDHYVVPSMCYGPLVARAHGKQSFETETWFVNSEYLLPQTVQFLASGQAHLAPWHPRALFDRVPGVADTYHIPAPVVAASAAFNHFLTGKPFEKVVFRDHLPWVFQFGKDRDTEGVLLVVGQLTSIGSTDPKAHLWSQTEAPNGTLTIDNADGLLTFHDLVGNEVHQGEKTVTLPLTIEASYITCTQGPAVAAARLARSRINGIHPVEIQPHDFSQLVSAPDVKLDVTLHNCLPQPVSGTLQAKGPETLVLATDSQPVTLAPGETKVVSFPFRKTTVSPANAYPFTFHFRSDVGTTDYSETLHAAVAPHRTFAIDGNLDKWKDVPGLTVVAQTQKIDATELMRRPWLEILEQQPEGNVAEFKVAWDEQYLYFAARVNDPTPDTDEPPMHGRDDNQFFHAASSDALSPYKEFLEKYPGRSFAEVPYVYRSSPEQGIPFRRDRLQVALDVTPDWHDLTPDTDRVPYGFHAVPDTDYEYSLYPCAGGTNELWRQLAPGVPRINDWPRQPHGTRTTGLVPGSKSIVKRVGNTYFYEMAIPRAELATMKLAPGTTFGLMMRAGNNKGPSIDSAQDKAVTKPNSLTMHPYWEPKPSCGVRWTLLP